MVFPDLISVVTDPIVKYRESSFFWVLVHCFYCAFRGDWSVLDLISQYKLCQRLCHIEKKASGPCFSYQLKKCLGACCGKEQAKLYNLRVDMALTHINNQQWPWSTPIIVEEQSQRKNGVDSHFHLNEQRL